MRNSAKTTRQTEREIHGWYADFRMLSFMGEGLGPMMGLLWRFRGLASFAEAQAELKYTYSLLADDRNMTGGFCA